MGSASVGILQVVAVQLGGNINLHRKKLRGTTQLGGVAPEFSCLATAHMPKEQHVLLPRCEQTPVLWVQAKLLCEPIESLLASARGSGRNIARIAKRECLLVFDLMEDF